MRLDPLRNIRAESHVVLRAVVTTGKVDQVYGADNVAVPPIVEESHQSGVLSVSTMYRRLLEPRGTRLIRKPLRACAFRSAFGFEE